jgi:hypothetical protein
MHHRRYRRCPPPHILGYWVPGRSGCLRCVRLRGRHDDRRNLLHHAAHKLPHRRPALACTVQPRRHDQRRTADDRLLYNGQRPPTGETGHVRQCWAHSGRTNPLKSIVQQGCSGEEGSVPKRAAGGWLGRSCLLLVVCVAATVLGDPARSPGARNQRSREAGRLDARSDSIPHARGQLSPTQPTHTALGSVLRRANPAPSQVAPPRPPPLTSRPYVKQGTGSGPWGDGCMSPRCCGSDCGMEGPERDGRRHPCPPPPCPPPPPSPAGHVEGCCCWEPRRQRQLCQV